MTFTPFTPQHYVTLFVGIILSGVLIIMGKNGGQQRTSATAVLAFCNLAAYPLNQAGWLMLDHSVPLDNILPFHLCDIAAITAGFALLLRHHLLATLTYFWGLAATIQALLTPAIHVGFPHFAFIAFFLQHFAIVAAALYLPIVEGWRPKRPFWKSPVEVYLWSLGYLAFALVINFSLGTNFGFVNRPPENPSLLDHLGPWPLYLIPMQLLALTFFLILALPFRKAVRDAPPGSPRQ